MKHETLVLRIPRVHGAKAGNLKTCKPENFYPFPDKHMEKPIGIIEEAQAVLAVENGKKPGTSIRNRKMNLRNRLERAL